MSNKKIRNSNLSSEETNPIVIKLCEFGYDSVFSRRVFHYLHPEDLEEALNYMAIENGIIQHRFVHNRNTSNIICYICGEKQNIHLKELSISLNVNENSIEVSKKDLKENNETNSNQTQRNIKVNNNIYNFENNLRKSLSSSTIKNSEYSTNEKNKNNNNNNCLSSESLNISFNKVK